MLYQIRGKNCSWHPNVRLSYDIPPDVVDFSLSISVYTEIWYDIASDLVFHIGIYRYH